METLRANERSSALSGHVVYAMRPFLHALVCLLFVCLGSLRHISQVIARAQGIFGKSDVTCSSSSTVDVIFHIKSNSYGVLVR